MSDLPSVRDTTQQSEQALPQWTFSNKVKTKDLTRSQVFSVKNQTNGRPVTMMVNKDVDQKEALAGIALLNKHEQAMRRYEGKSSQDFKKGLKPEWKSSARAPSLGDKPYVSLLAEPGDYRYIQIKQTNFGALEPAKSDIQSPPAPQFNATQSFKDLSRQMKSSKVDVKDMADILARAKKASMEKAPSVELVKSSAESEIGNAVEIRPPLSNTSKSPVRDLLRSGESEAFRKYKEGTRDVLGAISRPSFSTQRSEPRIADVQPTLIEPVYEVVPKQTQSKKVPTNAYAT